MLLYFDALQEKVLDKRAGPGINRIVSKQENKGKKNKEKIESIL